jgi:exosortase B
MSVDTLKSDTRPAAGASALEARRDRSFLLYAGAMGVCFLLTYLPTYIALSQTAWRSEQEGHGPLIMLAAAWLAWQQREKVASLTMKPALVAGWSILMFGLLLLVLMRSQHQMMVEVFSQIPVLFGGVLLLGGWPLARVFAFPIAFLFFSVPPPGWLMDAFTVPLKLWISDLVTNFLYDLGYPIAQNGVMIMIGQYQLLVKDACSGMNSIFALSAIGIFYVHEFVRNNWFRAAVLILAIIPITIVANFFRVLTLVLASYYFGVDAIEGLFHDLTGIALFVFALFLFFVLDAVLIGLGFVGRRLWRMRSMAAA